VLSSGINPESHQKVHEFLYGTMRLPVRYNKTGGLSAGAGELRDILIHLRGMKKEPARDAQIESCESLLNYRETVTQLKNFTKYPLDEWNKIHPSYLPAAKDSEGLDQDGDPTGKGLAGTLRITSHDPNVQNQPMAARGIYIPPQPGWVLVEMDWNQIEARILAALSGDEELQKALDQGLHSRNMEIMRCDRVRAKGFFYGTCFGAGARKLAMMMRGKGFEVSEGECKAAQQALFAAYRKFAGWRRGIVDEVSKSYRLRTPFGTMRYFWGGGRDATAALDFPSQASTACISWKCMRPLHDRIVEARVGVLHTLVHDSVLASFPAERVEEGIAIMRSIMEQEWPQIKPGFFVPASVKTSTLSWGEVK
jgi:hypothetical protein